MDTELKPAAPKPALQRHVSASVARLPIPGESVCGDAALVQELAGGCLIAAADGLGHGAEAARAAERAVGALRAAGHGKAIQLLQACHTELRSTRGAVMSLAWIQYADDTLTWLGVGNVGGLLLRAGTTGEGATEHLLCRGGTVGVSLPPPYAAMTTIAPGDTLLLFTDGLDAKRIMQFSDLLMPPERAAATLLRTCRRADDDALVLVARYDAGVPA
ncbi:MAG: SpoIIE family protein phosphatase [Terriglobales bacterium]